MARKQKSRVPLWVRAMLLVPLPVIAFLVIRAGNNPREGLFESVLSDLTVSAAGAPIALRLPVYLPNSDFRLADTIQLFDRENLYIKIDGHDVAFFRFGFVSLTFASYAGGDGAIVDVYAYQMDRRENALGIYAAERSDKRGNLDIHDAGYTSGGAVFFYRGPWYVQIIPSGSGAGVKAAKTEIADTLGRILPSPGEQLAALDWFPPAGRVENANGYFPDNAFGVDFISDVFTTEYSSGEGTITAFRHQSDSAGAVFDRYRKFLDRQAEPQGIMTIGGIPVHRYLDYGEHIWIFAQGDIFVGLMGAAEAKDMEKLAGELIAVGNQGQSTQ